MKLNVIWNETKLRWILDKVNNESTTEKPIPNSVKGPGQGPNRDGFCEFWELLILDPLSRIIQWIIFRLIELLLDFYIYNNMHLVYVVLTLFYLHLILLLLFSFIKLLFTKLFSKVFILNSYNWSYTPTLI